MVSSIIFQFHLFVCGLFGPSPSFLYGKRKKLCRNTYLSLLRANSRYREEKNERSSPVMELKTGILSSMLKYSFSDLSLKIEKYKLYIWYISQGKIYYTSFLQLGCRVGNGAANFRWGPSWIQRFLALYLFKVCKFLQIS